MPRVARIVVPGHPHHITQKGNYQQNVFFDDSDRRVYLKWLEKYSKQYKLKFLIYCLMTNHVHFIAVPEELDSLARTFNTVHMMYAQYLNKRKEGFFHVFWMNPILRQQRDILREIRFGLGQFQNHGSGIGQVRELTLDYQPICI